MPLLICCANETESIEMTASFPVALSMFGNSPIAQAHIVPVQSESDLELNITPTEMLSELYDCSIHRCTSTINYQQNLAHLDR
jgi:hypothetical protein